MSKFFSRLMTLLGLLLLAGVALADSSNSANSVVAQIGDPSVTNHTDLSLSYLSQVFGTVGSSLQGTAGQMLGQLFYDFNIGILVVAGVFMGYTAIQTVLNMAINMEGTLKKSTLQLLRLAIGVGCILPNSATGYSVFQDVVMKVVVEGVALADMTWRYGLSYIVNGGTLWASPTTQGLSALGYQTMITDSGSHFAQQPQTGYNPPLTYKSPVLSSAYQILRDETCMIASSYQLALTNGNNSPLPPPGNGNGNVPIYNSNSQPGQLTPILTKTGFNFPGVNGPGDCGNVQWIAPKTVYDANDATVAQNALYNFINDLQPAAQELACTYPGFSKIGACQGQQYQTKQPQYGNSDGVAFQAVFSAIVNYANAIMPIAQLDANRGVISAADFVQQAESDGWMTAGRYYWDLSQVSANNAAIQNMDSYFPSVINQNSNSSSPNGSTTSGTAGVANAKRAVDNNMFSIYFGGNNLGTIVPTSAVGMLLTYNGTSQQGYTGGYEGSLMSSGNSTIDFLLGPIYADVVNLFGDFDRSHMGTDPVLFLHNIGMDSIGVAADIWLILPVVIFIILIGAGFMNCAVNFGPAFEFVASWIKAPLMILASALVSIGVVLGYYVPLYPYILFTLGVVGWLISVVEAMAAAPLVCLGLTHPDGHDFLGQAQQAIMLLLGVFIRPVLMVIGLIAAMILSYVSLKIIVYTYTGFLSDLFSTANSGASSGNISSAAGSAISAIAAQSFTRSSMMGVFMSIFAFPIFLAFFTVFVYLVFTQCCSTIYALPDEILKWIGGPQASHGRMAEQLVGQLKGAAQTAGSTIGQMASEQARALSQTKAPETGSSTVSHKGGSSGTISSTKTSSNASKKSAQSKA